MVSPNPPSSPTLPQQWAGIVILLVTVLLNLANAQHWLPTVPVWLATLVNLVGGTSALGAHVLGRETNRVAIMMALRRQGVLRAAVPVMLLPLLLFGLGGCTTIQTWLGGGYSATQTELNETTEAMTVGNDALQWLALNCITAPNALTASICANKANIKKGADAYAAAAKSLDALVNTQNATPAAVDALIAALAQDAALANELESGGTPTLRGSLATRCTIVLHPDGSITPCTATLVGSRAKLSPGDVTYIIQIVEAAIPVAIEVFTQIQSLLATNPTVSTVDSLSATAQTDVAPLDAW